MCFPTTENIVRHSDILTYFVSSEMKAAAFFLKTLFIIRMLIKVPAGDRYSQFYIRLKIR